jgi:hypothetical protein
VTTTSAGVRDLVKEGIAFKVDIEPVQRVIHAMPKVAYFWLREFFGRSFGLHRKQWLATKSTRFGRSTEGGKGIRVGNVGHGSGPLAPNEVRYSVQPTEARQPNRAAAVDGLRRMQAEIATGNEVLGVHQFGATMKPVRRIGLFVPVRTVPGNVRRWRKKYPNKKLLMLPSKRDKSERLIYEVTKKRGRGRPRKDGTESRTVEKLRLRFLVKRAVVVKPTLKFYESWDSGASVRTKLFADVADKMLRDLARRDPRDL